MPLRITVISDKSDASPLGAGVKEELLRRLKGNGFDPEVFDLELEDLHHCTGCFGCWLKTPGVCIFGDVGRDLCGSIMRSDLTVFISPVKYGCYSPVIRRVWDRLIPVILPFFKKIGGEVHHAPRYDRYPGVVVVGVGPNIAAHEAETFKSLTDANALNFHAGAAKTYICREERDIAALIRSLLRYLQERKAA